MTTRSLEGFLSHVNVFTVLIASESLSAVGHS